MKKEFPVLYAKGSMLVATPLLGLVAYSYVAHAISQPASAVYGIGIASFGVSAALSAICFTVSEPVQGSPDFRYAGEKFLHSSVLLIQTMMLIYLRDLLTASSWLDSHLWLGALAKALPVFLLPLLSGAAAVTWYHGFDALNSRLWRNWERRMEDINKSA